MSMKRSAQFGDGTDEGQQVKRRNTFGGDDPLKQDEIPVTWNKINPVYEIGHDIVQARHGHRAVVWKHLMIVFSGGNEGLFQEMNVYSTVTNTWFKPQLTGEVPPGKASYGAAINGQSLFIFGGAEQDNAFSDSLYECNLQTWECALLKPEGHNPKGKPCGRIGHSFTAIDGDDRIFMFGGLIQSMNNSTGFLSNFYLNDFYVLYPHWNKNQGLWEKPKTFGNKPMEREGHAAVGYKNLDDTKLLVFGGTTCGARLGDVHSLDVKSMTWTEILTRRIKPRSLHTATLIGERVYIFGGWLLSANSKHLGNPWKVSDELHCFNVKTECWESVRNVGSNENADSPGLTPPARAGHSAVAIDGKIYMWSGRHGHERDEDGRQICLDDLWMLDVPKVEQEEPNVPVEIPQVFGIANIKDEIPDVEELEESPDDFLMAEVDYSQNQLSFSHMDVAEVIKAFQVARLSVGAPQIMQEFGAGCGSTIDFQSETSPGPINFQSGTPPFAFNFRSGIPPGVINVQPGTHPGAINVQSGTPNLNETTQLFQQPVLPFIQGIPRQQGSKMLTRSQTRKIQQTTQSLTGNAKLPASSTPHRQFHHHQQ